MGAKSGVTYVISHNYANTKVSSFDSLLLEKTLIYYNVIMHIKSVWNKDKNNYYYIIFLEHCSDQLPINNNKSYMSYYVRIDSSEGNDINKTKASKECNICHYCYFLIKYF